MKKVILSYLSLATLMLAASCFSTKADPVGATPAEFIPLTEPDTIILRLDNGQEVKIISEDNNEVEVLNNYDLNAIIDDLRESMDSVDSEQEPIEIEDRTGEKYLGKNNDSDSVSLRAKVDRLTHKLEELSINIRLNNDEDDDQRQEEPSRRYERKKYNYYGTDNMLSFDFGLNNYLNSNGEFPDESNALYAVKPVQSWYVAVGLLNKTHVAGPLFIDWGANVSWYNFKFQNNRTRLKKTDTEVVFSEQPDIVDPIKSKLVVPYLNASFVPMLHFGRPGSHNWFVLDRNKGEGFRIGGGVYAGYRLGSRAKYVSKEDNERQRVKDRTNFYVNNWRYGVRVQLGINGIDLFANYDLNELFVAGRGPELNAFSFGIVF